MHVDQLVIQTPSDALTGFPLGSNRGLAAQFLYWQLYGSSEFGNCIGRADCVSMAATLIASHRWEKRLNKFSLLQKSE
jgi:hypothetical protein